MVVRALFITDALQTLKPLSDTSLHLARAAFEIGFDVYFADAQSIEWRADDLFFQTHRVRSIGMQKTPIYFAPQKKSIQTFQVAMIRKDPPFDESYVRLCWLLAPWQNQVRFLNRPDVLLRFHEKMIPFEAVRAKFLKSNEIVQSYLSQSAAARPSRSGKSTTMIQKPWLGHAGEQVQKVKIDVKISDGLNWILQPFQKEIVSEGDRRVFVFDGRVMGDFVRMPKKGGFVSNLAAGGSAEFRPLRSSQKNLLERMARFLKQQKIEFAGVDLIGQKINEVNITSPTGLSKFYSMSGIDLSLDIMKSIKRSLR